MPQKTAEILAKVKEAAAAGKLKRGAKETASAIRQGTAKLVVIAVDVSPVEIINAVRDLCRQNKVQYVAVESKTELGEAAGLPLPTSAVAILK